MYEIEKSDSEWRAQLSDEEFRICRQKGTERPFTGEYWDTWSDGTYRCKCCGEPLFEAGAKFDAGCGWPSFYQPNNKNSIEEQRDMSHGMIRTEVMCRRCGSHLGHVFEDGPEPTGLRYCINSASIQLESEDK
jgi:peptide-methionine (R)-S-oxide reductase